MAEPDNVLTKLHDLLLYSIPQLAKMPRDQKYLLGDRIETKMLEGWLKQTGAPARPPPPGNR